MLRFTIPTFIKLLIAVDFILIALHLGYFLAGTPIDKLDRLINLDSETSVATWYSSAKHLLTALVCLPTSLYFLREGRARAYLFALLPLVFLLFSLDEISLLHESAGSVLDVLLFGGEREQTPYTETGMWMIVLGVPFILVFSILLYTLRAYLKRVPGAQLKVLLGLSLLFLGAVGVEILTNISADESWGRRIQVAFEEGLEMLGLSLALWGFYSLLELSFVWHLKDPTNPENAE